MYKGRERDKEEVNGGRKEDWEDRWFAGEVEGMSLCVWMEVNGTVGVSG